MISAEESTDTMDVVKPDSDSAAAAEITVPDDTKRFQMELEFVQCLANPAYLHCACCISHTSRFIFFLCVDISFGTEPVF